MGDVPPATDDSSQAEGVAVQLEGQTAGYYGGGATTEYEQPAAEPVDEDDAVIVPPPPMEYLAHGHPAVPPGGGVPRYKNIKYQQTLVPVLLTMSICLAGIGVAKMFCREDTVIGALNPILQIALFVLAGISLVSGVLMMLQVRSSLAEQRTEKEQRRAAAL
jgi:hypothetical protein